MHFNRVSPNFFFYVQINGEMSVKASTIITNQNKVQVVYILKLCYLTFKGHMCK